MAITMVVHDDVEEVFRPHDSSIDPALPGGKPDHTHTQSTPAVTWVVNHNLNTKKIELLVFETTGEQVYASPDHGGASLNSIAINFPVPVAGEAVVRSL
jgi:hypothetical protein